MSPISTTNPNKRISTEDLINLDLFQNALDAYFKESHVKVLNFTSKKIEAKGDHYGSDIFKCKVTYENKIDDIKTMDLFLKCSPTSGLLRSLDNEIHLFEKEAEMYQIILPKLETIAGNIGIFSPNWITCIKTQHNNILVMQDLTPLGYKMANRRTGLDLEHCVAAMEHLAKYHAASVKMIQEDPSIVSNYMHGLFNNVSELSKSFILDGFQTLANVSASWPGCEKIANKLQDFLNNKEVIARMVKSIERTSNALMVLNHGDLWVNNIMFAYNADGKIKTLKYIDYQLGVYTSPAIDLHYFLATSPEIEVRRNNFEKILETYYGHLLVNLVKLDYPLNNVPSWQQFRNDFKDRAFYEVVASATVLPLIKCSERLDANYEQFTDTNPDNKDNFRMHSYSNDCYRSFIRYVLFPYFEESGIVD